MLSKSLTRHINLNKNTTIWFPIKQEIQSNNLCFYRILFSSTNNNFWIQMFSYSSGRLHYPPFPLSDLLLSLTEPSSLHKDGLPSVLRG